MKEHSRAGTKAWKGERDNRKTEEGGHDEEKRRKGGRRRNKGRKKSIAILLILDKDHRVQKCTTIMNF